MTTASIIHTQHTSLRTYFADVGHAALAFAAALFAARERHFVAQPVAPTLDETEKAKAKSRMKLFALAKHYDDIEPSLAREMRSLASRG